MGIDLGTQSLKVIIYNTETKHLEAEASSPVDIIQDTNGCAEQKAEWWLAAMADCFSQLPESLKQSVEALAVSGQQHGFVPVAVTGKVLANVKLWCDIKTDPARSPLS